MKFTHFYLDFYQGHLIYDTLYKYKMKRHTPILNCMA